MTYQQTAALLSLAMNYWDNICSKTNAKETAKAWAASLSDIPYNAALKAVQELSKTHRFKPTVSEVREAAVKYSAYNVADNWSMRLAWDRYTELGIPLPKWFYTGVKALGASCPAEYLQAHCNGQQISAGACR
nr:MAG TPA: replisome organizer protein [Caudoviricetes sp.]